MKARCLAALLAGLLMTPAWAEESAVDSQSLWITSITPAGDGTFVVGSATGLLLRPAAVFRVPADNVNDREKLYEHPAAVWTVDATSDGQTIVSADYRGNLIVYDVKSKQPKTFESALERWCQALAIAPDDQSVLAGNESGKLFHWNLADGKVAKTIDLSKASITSLAFSPDKSQVAATDGEGKVHLLKWPSLETTGTVTISDDTAWCVAYSGDSKSLVVGSADRNLYRVAAKADAKPESIASGSDWITRIAVS